MCARHAAVTFDAAFDEDLPDLPFTRRVIDEAMRIYPPAWGFSRQALGDDELGGYRLPRGRLAFLMPYVLRRQAGGQRQMGALVVFVRRAAVVLILMAAYAYERVISGYLPLASIGLISFAAVSNFADMLITV